MSTPRIQPNISAHHRGECLAILSHISTPVLGAADSCTPGSGGTLTGHEQETLLSPYDRKDLSIPTFSDSTYEAYGRVERVSRG